MSEEEDETLRLNFTLRPWQAAVHQRLRKFNVVVVARGSGKTKLCCLEIMMRALTAPPRAEFLFLGPYKNQMHRNTWTELMHIASMIPNTYVNNNRLEIVFQHNKARVTVLGADDPESLRGKHCHGMIVDEFDDMPPMDKIWPIIFPMLTNYDGWLLMTGTPKGRRNLYAKIAEANAAENKDDWFVTVLPWDKAKALSQKQIDHARATMSKDMFDQEFGCSFEASNIGAYYTRQISELRQNGNIVFDGSLYDPNLETNVAIDIGMRDYTACVWWQNVRDKTTGEDVMHVIDFEQSANLGLPDWNDIICHRERTLGYRRGTIVFPHDIKVREWGANVSRLEAAENLGIHPAICPDHKVEDRIELCRLHLPKTRFDGRKCEELIECLAQYREKTNKNGIGMGIPDKNDGVDHAADAFAYGMVYAKQVMNQPALVRMPFLRRR